MPNLWGAAGSAGHGSAFQNRGYLDRDPQALPVLQCRQCGDTELEQATMSGVDQLLAAVDGSAELEVIRYAA